MHPELPAVVPAVPWRAWAGRLEVLAWSALALLLGLLLGGLLILLAGVNPLRAYAAMLYGAFGSTNNLGETLVKAIPISLTGLAVAVAFRAGFWNIGAEGQLYCGALGATVVGLHAGGLPPTLAVSATLLGGTAAGAVCGWIPGVLKGRFGTSEAINTIMLNFIAIQLVAYEVYGPLRQGVGLVPESDPIAAAARLPILVPATRLHAGLLLAVAAMAITAGLMRHTVFGYRLALIGTNPLMARFGGLRVGSLVALTAAVSGALAGLAGAIEVMGVHYRLIEAISPGYGFLGIAAALLARLNAWGVGTAGFLLAALVVGADTMERIASVPVPLVFIVQGVVILFVLAFQLQQARREA